MNKLKIFLILFILLLPISTAQEGPVEEDVTGTTTEFETTEEEFTEQELQNIENTESIFTPAGSTKTVNDPTYFNDKLKEDYESNVEFDSSIPVGTRIDEDGDLYDSAGNKILNVKTYNGPTPLKFEDGKLVINEGGFEGVEGITGEGDTIRAETVGSFSNPIVNLNINNAKGLEFSPDKVLVEYAESINLLDHTLDKVHYFFYDMGDNIELEKADDVYVDGIHFRDVINSSFKISGNQLTTANVKAGKNQTFELWNPINGSFNKIHVHVKKNKKFNMDFRKINEYGDKMIKFAIEPGIIVKLFKVDDKELSFNPMANESTLEITEGEPPAYEIDQANLTFSTTNYSETLEGVGTAYIDTEIGCRELILKPVLIIEPGGRYTYEDKQNKESSFSLFNHGTIDFYLGINKQGEAFYDTYKQGKDKNWGFIDLPDEFKEFNGIISYEKYGTVPISQNIHLLKFLNVYTKNDINNIADFTEQSNELNLFLKNSNPAGDYISLLNYGTTEIIEKADKRTLKINNLPATYYLQSYKYRSRPEIIFNDKKTIIDNVVVYNLASNLLDKTSSLVEFEGFFNLQIASVNEQYRSYHLYLTQER